jgi:CheY-like chemotaxis protein
MSDEKRVLIVEDSLTIRYEIKLILEQIGVKLVEAANEIGLFMKIEEYGKVVDLIIMDLTLEYENGFDLIKKIRNADRYKDIPIIIITEHADKGNVLKAMQYNIAGYLRKPISKNELIKKIESLLNTQTEE